MKHIIVTGHSKGLGAGIVTELLDEGHHIHGISRTDSPDLHKIAAAKGCKISFYPCDLSHTDTIPSVVNRVFANIPKEKTKGVYLINNAGIISPIGPLQTLDPAEIDLHMRINLSAPIHISREFLKYFQDWDVEKRILNISSGAAVNPYFGWSAYCTGKAGLDMLTRCIATEQQQQPYPTHIMAVAPGIIDTGMQTIIRGTSEEQFIFRNKFVELKETGQLVAPNLAGKKLVNLLFSENFNSGTIADIRDQY